MRSAAAAGDRHGGGVDPRVSDGGAAGSASLAPSIAEGRTDLARETGGAAQGGPVGVAAGGGNYASRRADAAGLRSGVMRAPVPVGPRIEAIGGVMVGAHRTTIWKR
jgi:hypothetical protein